MNILFHFRTQGGGAEGVHLAGMADAFEQLGHRLIFQSPTGADPRLTAGNNPFRSTRPGFLARLAAKAPSFIFELLEIGYNLVGGWQLARQLGKQRCDLIYERHAFFLCAGAVLARFKRLPLVVEVNELAGDERIRAKPWLSPLAHLADRFTFQQATLIVVVSPHLRRRIVESGIAAEKVLVLPNAVKEEVLNRPTNAARIRRQFGCDSALVVGFVGWFVKWHRLEMLIEAFSRLDPSVNARLLLVGDGPLRAELARQAAESRVGDRVIFAGAVPHAEIADYVAAMDVCVVPHSNEFRSPIKLFEYMAQGRAVLVPRTEPIAEVVHHQENGLLFSPGESSELSRQLATLLGDAELRTRLGRQARADVAARHTWIQNARAVLRHAGLDTDAR